jgi:hypothetical protein
MIKRPRSQPNLGRLRKKISFESWHRQANMPRDRRTDEAQRAGNPKTRRPAESQAGQSATLAESEEGLKQRV